MIFKSFNNDYNSYIILKYIKTRNIKVRVTINLVPVVGLEPTQYCYQWILSPSCLPIPPYRHKNIISYFYYSSSIIPLSVVISIMFNIDKVDVIKSSRFISTS